MKEIHSMSKDANFPTQTKCNINWTFTITLLINEDPVSHHMVPMSKRGIRAFNTGCPKKRSALEM